MFNGAPFPASAMAEGRQLNGAPSLWERVKMRGPKSKRQSQSQARGLQDLKRQHRRRIGCLQVLSKSPLLLLVRLPCCIPGAVNPTEIPAGLEEEQNGPSDVEFFVYSIRRAGEKGAVQGKRRQRLEWFPGIKVAGTGEDA